ncbi:hypothetical protein UO65_0178 [Actinokineospora spheciospongiae]|uniref:Secreted protein n=1 Tax=Actinokineospora spheciospongiae TaxID=909613 RepID=W7J6E4_9PSEU|nr:hypothetical protein [Actinokineospora spheciospongiae]EWC64571.1 hypothetical protein UO65_0178 [Actinokineospora spheciospongiae]PWW53071.1 hypothetical protein DFQ13_11660 [Actinokineospora spheciospongiae]
MIRTALAASLLTAAFAVGSAGSATAQPAPAGNPPAPAAASAPTPEGMWFPVFFFGTEGFCTQVGTMAQQSEALEEESWKCEGGWLLIHVEPDDAS